MEVGHQLQCSLFFRPTVDISDGAEVTEPRRPVKRLVVESLDWFGRPVKGDVDGHRPDGRWGWSPGRIQAFLVRVADRSWAKSFDRRFFPLDMVWT